MPTVISNAPLFAIIIGSGFAGLCMAIALKRAGIDDFVVLEKASAIGGTWRDNEYPGCACDVPSHVYSYSFDPNPRWTETYATQGEIRAYIERCADRFDVRKHVRLDTMASSAAYDEASGTWLVETSTGERLRARMVVAGLGPLARFTLPAIKGLGSFEGKVFHSAAWDKSFDPAGKRIATVGTGASAIQFVPALAESAGQMHVFQRTPAWVLPREERAYAEIEKVAFEKVPGLRLLHRQAIFWSLEARAFGFLHSPAVLKVAERLAVKNIERAISDPALRRALTPSYRMGCKRILMSNTYYPALAKPSVELVTSGLVEVTRRGVVGGDGRERPVDAIVFGTGFDVHDYLGALRCTGRGGSDLGALWGEQGAQAYLGMTVAGFPNLFVLVGPNTGLGHNSIIFMIESQVEHIMKAVSVLRERPTATIEVRAGVQRAYNERLQEKLRSTVWQTGCVSWYLDRHGRNTTIWPGFCFEYRMATRRFALSDYEVVSHGAGAVERPGQGAWVAARGA